VRLVAYEDAEPRAGLVNCGAVHPLAAPMRESLGSDLAAGGLELVIGAAPVAIGGLKLLAPVSPTALFVAEDNYRSQPRPRRAGLALLRPQALEPFLLSGPADDVLIAAADPRSIAVSGQPIIRPAGCRRLDAGVALLVVVGKRPDQYTPPAVAAFGVCIDVVQRDVPQTQTFLARSFPSHTLVGATLTTPENLGDASDLRLTLDVDGERRQDGTTADMIASPAQLIETIARRYPLAPGDVVLTGTPAGVGLDHDGGWLEPGSRLRAEIEGLGRVEAQVVAEEQR
jgi:2-keto-4-pentenoate hydratase/2-oxohepta-3-ene-1,7-dioic acid hydratase in catechol pathway